MSDQISCLHHAAAMPVPNDYEASIENVRVESAEEVQGELLKKIRQAQERTKECVTLSAKAKDATESLQQSGGDGDAQSQWCEYAAQQRIARDNVDSAVDQVIGRSLMDSSVDESHRDFFDRLAAAMADLNSEWLSKYEDALARYIEFFTDFNSIMAELQKYVKASSDGQKVDVEFGELYNQLNALVNRFLGFDKGLAYFSSEQEARKFIEDLGLTGLTIKSTADGVMVTIDLGPVFNLRNSMPRNKETWDMARYNAWLSGKDSYTEQLQHVSKVLGEKYSRNLQLLDTLFKVLSSSIDSIGETDRTFVNNF